MAKYYEDFHVGQEWTSPGRTITEADVTMFAMLSGDYKYTQVSRRIRPMLYNNWLPVYREADNAGLLRIVDTRSRFTVAQLTDVAIHFATLAATAKGGSFSFRRAVLFTTILISRPASLRDEATGMELWLTNSRTKSGELVSRPDTAHTSSPAL